MHIFIFLTIYCIYAYPPSLNMHFLYICCYQILIICERYLIICILYSFICGISVGYYKGYILCNPVYFWHQKYQKWRWLRRSAPRTNVRGTLSATTCSQGLHRGEHDRLPLAADLWRQPHIIICGLRPQALGNILKANLLSSHFW